MDVLCSDGWERGKTCSHLSPLWAGERAAAGSSQVAFPELPWSTVTHSEDKYILCCPDATAMWPNAGNILNLNVFMFPPRNNYATVS